MNNNIIDDNKQVRYCRYCNNRLRPTIVRLAEHLVDGSWLALRCQQDDNPFSCGISKGMQIEFAQG